MISLIFLIQLFLTKRLTVNRKWLPLLLIVVLEIILFFVRRYTGISAVKDGSQVIKGDQAKHSKVDRNRGFDRRVSYLEYQMPHGVQENNTVGSRGDHAWRKN